MNEPSRTKPAVAAAFSELLSKLPGPSSAKWPTGERFATALKHGTMSVEVYAPMGHDPQTPHQQDELYFVMAGAAQLVIEGERHRARPGDCLFVAAGQQHHFEAMTADFATWVVFWGDIGGEFA